MAIRDVVDLVVVVEHDPAEPGHAEVLEQQIPGEYIDRGKLLQRVAVVADRALALRRRRLFEEKVERRHPPLDVDVLDEDHLAVLLVRPGRDGIELRDELARETCARKCDVGILEGVRHAADPVVMLHQQVLLLHLLRRRVLRRRDLVADHLEDVRIRRQRENRHHQPLDAGRDDEVIGRVLEVMEKIAEEQRLSLLLQADHRVELGFGAHRHHAAQERHVRRGHLHVDQKIRPVG